MEQLLYLAGTIAFFAICAWLVDTFERLRVNSQ